MKDDADRLSYGNAIRVAITTATRQLLSQRAAAASPTIDNK